MNKSMEDRGGNACVPESVFIKEEVLSDDDDALASAGRQFCILCLRNCASEVFNWFSAQSKETHIDRFEGRRKLELVLGPVTVSLKGSGVCHTCWKLVELMTNFRELCTKSADWIERFARGVQYEAEIDNWLSQDVFNSVEALHKGIQISKDRIDQEENSMLISSTVKATEKRPIKQIKTDTPSSEDDMNDVPDDTEVESFDTSQDVFHSVESLHKNVENNGNSFESGEIPAISPPKAKAVKRSRKKVVKEAKASENGDVPDGAQNENIHEGFPVPITPKVNNGKKTRPKKAKSAKGAILDEESLNSVLENDVYVPTLFPCNKCGRKFDGGTAHRMHEDRCVNDKDAVYYDCAICNASFRQTATLSYHMNKHNGIKPFKCRKFCDNTFFSNNVRIRHENSNCELGGRICPVCGVQLKNEYSLKKHIDIVHGEAKFVCTMCGKAFRRKLSLQYHQRSHSDERNYPCALCNKTYKSPYATKKHMRIHTQEKRYPCIICGEAFMYKSTMKSHVERAHGRAEAE